MGEYKPIILPCARCGEPVEVWIGANDPIPSQYDTPTTWCEPCEEQVYKEEDEFFRKIGLYE